MSYLEKHLTFGDQLKYKINKYWWSMNINDTKISHLSLGFVKGTKVIFIKVVNVRSKCTFYTYEQQRLCD